MGFNPIQGVEGKKDLISVFPAITSTNAGISPQIETFSVKPFATLA